MAETRARLAGDVDYAVHGMGYAQRRRADPRIAAAILDALGAARSVLNVGAGSGNYEPRDRTVVAVEPAAAMRAQRAPDAAPCVVAAAEALPFDDASVDACLACSTVHQWRDLPRGIAELRRVARGPVVILTSDPAAFERFWVTDYAPERTRAEAARMPPIDRLAALLGGEVEIRPVPIPADCSDGFLEAFYARPELLLRPEVRAAQSSWLHAGRAVEERFVRDLSADLASGRWDERHGAWRRMPSYEGSLLLVIGRPG